MKQLVFFVALFCFTSAHGRDVEDILEQREQKRSRYILNSSTIDAIVITMNYGEAGVISSTNISKLKKANILEVHLVYSDFPKDVDLTELNRRRILKAKELRKDLISNEDIQWKLIRQMACKNEAEANVLFHGIVILYRPEQSKETIERDLLSMHNLLPEIKSKKEAIAVAKTLPDSSILKILTRNKDWKNITVVTDVTGSMYPYLAQVALWYKLQEEDNEIKNVIVFNDGDMKNSDEKVVGSVEGIYSGEPKSFDEVVELMVSAMKKGGGGDGQENDLEAVLHAQKKYGSAKEIVLIADNMAPVRDMELLSKINVPVRVVLCGTQFGINVDYLNIALKTKGSIHTMEDDLDELFLLKEGAKVKIGTLFFVIRDGKFVPFVTKKI